MKVELKYPIELPGEKDNEKTVIKELIFGRIKVKHIKTLPESVFKEEASLQPAEVVPLIAGLCNISIEAADEIDIVDLKYIMGDVLPNFLSEFQQAEKK